MTGRIQLERNSFSVKQRGVAELNKLTASSFLFDSGTMIFCSPLGEKGSLLLTKNEETLMPPCRVEARDTTGIGDAFIGCFAAHFVETGDIRKAMETANRCVRAGEVRPVCPYPV
jgi:sugar/nucleoside kinase (ribokinase family)